MIRIRPTNAIIEHLISFFKFGGGMLDKPLKPSKIVTQKEKFGLHTWDEAIGKKDTMLDLDAIKDKLACIKDGRKYISRPKPQEDQLSLIEIGKYYRYFDLDGSEFVVKAIGPKVEGGYSFKICFGGSRNNQGDRVVYFGRGISFQEVAIEMGSVWTGRNHGSARTIVEETNHTVKYKTSLRSDEHSSFISVFLKYYYNPDWPSFEKPKTCIECSTASVRYVNEKERAADFKCWSCIDE